MNMMGHNSAGFGQMLKPVLPASPPKTPKARFPFFKFYPRDWLEATRDMSLEARGAYIDLICIIMEMEGHLADNDGWISHQMHVSTRKWRAVKGQLVEHEKISISDGKIINERCLKELDTLLTQRRNIAGSASVRERTKRESASNQARTEIEKSEKSNENNDPPTTIVPLRARVLDLDLDKDKERGREDPPREASLGRVAAAVVATMASSVMPIAVAAHPVDHVRLAPAECWQTPKAQMAAGISQQEAMAQRQIWITPLGGVEIAGEFKAEMQRMYPLTDIASALAAACPNIKVESGAWNAMQMVRRQFGYMQQDALKDERRRLANPAKYANKSSAASGEKPPKMPQKIWDEIQAAKKC